MNLNKDNAYKGATDEDLLMKVVRPIYLAPPGASYLAVEIDVYQELVIRWRTSVFVIQEQEKLLSVSHRRPFPADGD